MTEPMTTVEEHYENHLGPIYAWMLGDWETALENARTELREMGIGPVESGVAVDLGAGLGLHTLPLTELGYSVLAVDNSDEMLGTLRAAADYEKVHFLLGDLKSFLPYLSEPADVILCMGDTLTHLPSHQTVESLFHSFKTALAPRGRFLATFRDYVSAPLEGIGRFIPVRSDADRILTCFLEYQEDIVMVHDILHIREGTEWKLKVSAYPKIRLDPFWIQEALTGLGLETTLTRGPRGMVRVVAVAQGSGEGK